MREQQGCRCVVRGADMRVPLSMGRLRALTESEWLQCLYNEVYDTNVIFVAVRPVRYDCSYSTCHPTTPTVSHTHSRQRTSSACFFSHLADSLSSCFAVNFMSKRVLSIALDMIE